MGLFGKSEEKDDEGDTPPAVAKKDDDRHLRRQDSEAPTTVCPCACGNRFLDWMKGFIEIKPFKVEPRLAQMRWDEIRRENPLTYKLACITNVYGNITVSLYPKVGAAQWTR